MRLASPETLKKLTAARGAARAKCKFSGRTPTAKEQLNTAEKITGHNTRAFAR